MVDYRGAAELLKVMAHPARIELLQKLEADVLCVSDMGDILGVAQPNVSQHLSVLRRSGLVDYYMDGKQRCYFLKDPRVPDVLAVLNKKYKKGLPAPTCCPVKRETKTKRRAG